MQRWQQWGLSFEEWQDCVWAARELAELSPNDRTPSAEEIAAQLAVAKAAEEPLEPDDEPTRRLPVDR